VIYRPEGPGPVKLSNEKLLKCAVDDELMVCMTLEDAKALVRNKVEVGAWIQRAQNIIAYYENHPNLRSK
jgi:hypothetical protein